MNRVTHSLTLGINSVEPQNIYDVIHVKDVVGPLLKYLHHLISKA